MTGRVTQRCVVLVLLSVLIRCQCDEGLTEIPRPEIDVCVDDDSRCHDTDTLTLSIDLGAASIGGSLETAFVVHNRGTQPLAVTRVALAVDSQTSADFSLISGGFNGELAPESSQRFVVTYTPSDGGGDRATYEVLSSDADEPRVLVVITAQGDGPRICPSPPLVVSWGAVPVGTRVAQSYTFDSCGNQPLTIERVVLADDAEGVFFVDNLPALPLTLQPGASFDVDLAFAPDASQFFRGDLLIGSNDVAASEGHVTLEGTGAACDLDATPRQVLFGSVFQGVSETRDVLLRNRGTLDCTIGDVLQTAGSSEFTLTNGFTGLLSPGSQATLTFAYEPTNTGSDNAVFRVSSDDSEEPGLELHLEGQDAGRPECLLEIDPTIYDFGNVTRGTRGNGTLQLTNTGQRACFALHFSMASGSSPAFGFTAPGLSALGLQAGQSLSINVHFEPVRPGALTARLEVRVGLMRQLVTQAELRGSAGGPAICVDPERVDFAVTDVGSQSRQDVTVANCGNQPLDLSAISLRGSSDFSIDGSAPTGTIQPGDSVTVTVVYSPTDVGRDEGAIKLTSNDPVDDITEVTLIGHGVAPGTACGNIKGQICASDGRTWLSGATVWVDDGAGGRVEATTDGQGHFVLTCAPVGSQTVNVESGSWSASFVADVRDRQTTEIAEPQCVDPGSASIAVVLGCYDNIEDVLQRLGTDVDLYEFHNTNGCDPDDQPGNNEPDAETLFRDPVALATFDIIFVNCGAEDDFAYDAEIIGNLRDFVSAGGGFFPSDWAYDYLEQAWPDAIEFRGDDTARDAAQGAPYSCRASVDDPGLAAQLGVGSVDTSDSYVDVDAIAASTQSVLTCTEGNRNGQPLMTLFDQGAGRVGFTTFHNSSQTGSVIDQIFTWLIFHL